MQNFRFYHGQTEMFNQKSKVQQNANATLASASQLLQQTKFHN